MPQQLSLFEADGAEPAVDDLDGLLFGPGHVVSRAQTARVSVLTADAWRAEALVTAFAVRGLGGEYNVSRDTEHGLQFVARTDFCAPLVPLARRWSPSAAGKAKAGASKASEAGAANTRRLTPAGLRLWVIAAGRLTDSGYLLPLAGSEDARWSASGAALAALGLAGVLIGVRGGSPAYRISSRKRLSRLAILVGEPPPGAALSDWP